MSFSLDTHERARAAHGALRRHRGVVLLLIIAVVLPLDRSCRAGAAAHRDASRRTSRGCRRWAPSWPHAGPVTAPHYASQESLLVIVDRAAREAGLGSSLTSSEPSWPRRAARAAGESAVRPGRGLARAARRPERHQRRVRHHRQRGSSPASSTQVSYCAFDEADRLDLAARDPRLRDHPARALSGSVGRPAALPPDVSCEQISGTVWNGACSGLVAQGVQVGQRRRGNCVPLPSSLASLPRTWMSHAAPTSCAAISRRARAARSLRAISLRTCRSIGQLIPQLPADLAGHAQSESRFIQIEKGIVTAVQGDVEAHDLVQLGT